MSHYRRLSITLDPVQKVCSHPSNRCDPFEGLYQCPPFAEITQGATAKEIEDDTTAIHAAIDAVNAMQPVPKYTIRPWRAEKVESVWLGMPSEVKPRSRSVRVPEYVGFDTAIKREAGSGFKIPAVPNTKTRIWTSINLAERPFQPRPTTKPAPRAHMKYEDDEYSPQIALTAVEKDSTEKIRGARPKNVPTPALRRAPRRAVRAHSAVNVPVMEESDDEHRPQMSTSPAKPTKRTQENLLVQRKMLDYFGPHGRRGM